MKTKKTRITSKLLILCGLGLILFVGCQTATTNKDKEIENQTITHPEWSKNLSIYEVNIRQYTSEGTFNAFAEHLPRIKELGTDILWLMPINPIGVEKRKGSLGSYYSIQDYYTVNPEFGTEEDFRNLINKAHELDMYIIVDWVANHSSWDIEIINTHPEWYTKNEEGEIIAPEEDWSDVADFNFDVPEMREYMIDALKYWVEEFNIDGYRCDVAWGVPVDFWNAVRPELDKIKPVFMLAEAEGPEYHQAFDMTYTWEMHHIWNEIAQGRKSIEDMVKVFETKNTKYNSSDYRMYFTSNHDENSWKGTAKERMGDAVEAFTVLSFTIPGMPLIYSGQEACLDKQLLFFEKDEIDWTKECNLSEFYSALTKLKKENPALWNGNFGGAMERINTTADDKIFAFSRIKDDNQVITILNLSTENVEFEFINPVETELTELFTSDKIKNNFKLDAWGYKIFK